MYGELRLILSDKKGHHRYSIKHEGLMYSSGSDDAKETHRLISGRAEKMMGDIQTLSAMGKAIVDCMNIPNEKVCALNILSRRLNRLWENDTLKWEDRQLAVTPEIAAALVGLIDEFKENKDLVDLAPAAMIQEAAGVLDRYPDDLLKHDKNIIAIMREHGCNEMIWVLRDWGTHCFPRDRARDYYTMIDNFVSGSSFGDIRSYWFVQLDRGSVVEKDGAQAATMLHGWADLQKR